MTRRLGLLGLLTLAACTPIRIPVSSELVWTRADETEVTVSPGDVVRIEASGPLRVTSVFKGPQGEADVSETMTPKDGLILLRPGLGVSAVRLPGGTVVHTGYPKDPEISWFQLEREALDWAKAPVGTPFPTLGPAPRFDAADFADLDAALSEAKDSPAVLPIRKLVALRAIRALEGVRSYPYARNYELEFSGASATKEIQLRDFYQIAPGENATVTIEGPTSFALSSRMIRTGADVVAELRVREGSRLRGVSRAIVHHLAPEGDLGVKEKAPDVPPEALPDPTLAPLRRVFVPVPPGKHTYEIETVNASAWVAAADSSAYKKLEDAVSGSKSETSFAAAALASCESASLCAIAKVLAGDDKDGIDPNASPAAKKIAEKLALGAPADRAASLEVAASTGDRAAIITLGKEAASTVDLSVRDAWWLGTLRGTGWQTLEDPTPPTWFAFLPRDATGPAAATCSQRTTATEKELDANVVTLASEPWRRVNAVRLLAVAPCTPGEGPVELEVNGQKLVAQPSSARALWHITVPGTSAKVRRLDHGKSKVYALSDDQCGGGTLVHAAVPLNTQRTIAFPPNTTAPGVELWLKQGTPSVDLTLTSSQGSEPLEIKAIAGNGLAAIAEDGSRWIRSATIPLPAWPGVKASGNANVAVRGVARGLKTDVETANKPAEHAAAPNVEAVTAASKKLLAAKTNAEKGAAALERALLLASYGAERAAIEDADLAAHYGVTPDPIAAVRAKLLPLPPTPLELSTQAYGIEPDFDPNATRCSVNAGGERAKITQLETTLRARPKSASYDRNLAIQAASLANASPRDPRSDTLVTLAGASSKWKLSRDVAGAERVVRPHETERNPVLDSDARLRARYVAGDPFGNSFVSVSPDRPARAFVADIGNAKSRLDVICLPRKMPEKGSHCPIDIKMGEVPVSPKLDESGHASLELPHGRGRGKGAELNVTLKQDKADYLALIRVVFDKEAPGATKVEGVGWVLDTPHIQYRFVIQPGHSARIKATERGLMRIDAIPDTKEATEVTATFAGQSVVVPSTGDAKIIPITNVGEIVTVSAKGGPATIAVAERVDSDTRFPGNDAAPNLATVKPVEHETAQMRLPDGSGWRDVAEKSPKPLGSFAEHLGAFETMSGVLGATLRDGAPSDTAIDLYAFQTATYRRRIEPINLYTLATGIFRLRDGTTTVGGAVTLYEDLQALRLRITGTMNAFTQVIDGQNAVTLRPRGAIEYSARVNPSFYILPRVGYDGYYTTLDAKPDSSNNVDDDIYNGFRFTRNTFAFLQGLFWWVPYFNHIAYLRVRGTMDVTNTSFSHAAVRPGSFIIFGTLEAGAYLDAQYFERTTGARTSSGIDISGGGNIVLHFPIVPGSFELRPSLNGQVRGDLGWQAIAGITLIASARRGVRDYSSLELSFPEATGQGIPWRTEGKTP